MPISPYVFDWLAALGALYLSVMIVKEGLVIGLSVWQVRKYKHYEKEYEKSSASLLKLLDSPKEDYDRFINPKAN